MRTSQSFRLYFTLRLDKKKAGQAPLYVAITVNKEKSMVALKKVVDIDIWDTGRGIAKGHKNVSKQLNSYLNEVRTSLTNIYNDLQLKDKFITAQLIKNTFLGEDDYGYTLTKLIEYHNKTAERVLEPATMKHYEVSQRYLYKFIKDEYKLDDFALKDLDFHFIQSFDTFLRNYTPVDHQKPIMSNNGIMVHLIRLKKMMNLAHNLEWVQRNPFDNYKIRMKRVNKEYLTEEELSRIENHVFGIDRLDLIKDLFVFCCYTGLAYVDLMKLRPHQIVETEDHELWIRTTREKTDEPVNIPILEKAKTILGRYKLSPRASYTNTVFPVVSNQKVNSYLKEIARLCSVHKNLTFHIARHTFATTITLSNGVPIETVSKILGHSKLATTQIYAKVVEKKLKDDMQQLQKKLAGT